MAKQALVVAIEKYRGKFENVAYAENDAASMRSALEKQGYVVETLINDHATLATLTSRIKRCLRNAAQGDTFCFYYAGHGFCKSGTNYLTCYDTDSTDVATTSLNLDEVFKQIEQAACEKVLMFLDACESGTHKLLGTRSVITGLSEIELVEFFKGSKYRLCFSSCQPDESSFTYTTEKHGVWTYHVLQALNGHVPEILEKGKFLTGNALQDYLARAVPQTVKKLRTPGNQGQNPHMYGSRNHDFEVADVGSLVLAHQAKKTVGLRFKSFLFRKMTSIPVRNLPDFKKGHHVPDRSTPSTQVFVAGCAEKLVKERVETAFSMARSTFRYRSNQLEGEDEDRIIAPDFEYAVYAQQSEDDPEVCELIEELDGLSGPDPRLEQVFRKGFDELVL